MKFLRQAKGKQLFDAAVREPASMERRRELADWLVAKKDPLGAFILEQLQRPGSAEEGRLRVQHYEEWMGPLVDVVDPFSVKFHGGFPRELSLGDVDGSYSDLTPTWLRRLAKAAGAPQLAFVETVFLGKGVGLGAAQATDSEGTVAATTRTELKGRKIPLVAFLSHPAMKCLSKVVFDELAANVSAALTALIPHVTLEDRWLAARAKQPARSTAARRRR
jgi:hypothetical protein